MQESVLHWHSFAVTEILFAAAIATVAASRDAVENRKGNSGEELEERKIL